MAGKVASMMRPTLPNRLVMFVPPGATEYAPHMAGRAAELAKARCPKSSGEMAEGLEPVWGFDFFGVEWELDRTWYAETGTRAFTMKALAGKTIPMWLDDPTGQLAKDNPKAERRTTPSGRRQVLIFRRAAEIGATKKARRRVRGQDRIVRVSASYPGAPGRIVRREAPWPHTAPGRVGGQIAQGNVGVRWRHPGVIGRNFIRESLYDTAAEYGVPSGPVQAIGANR